MMSKKRKLPCLSQLGPEEGGLGGCGAGIVVTIAKYLKYFHDFAPKRYQELENKQQQPTIVSNNYNG